MIDKRTVLNWVDLFDECEAALIGSQCRRIRIAKKNVGNKKGVLPQQISNKSGLYAIWVNGDYKYIGHSKNIRSRLRSHICNKGRFTGAKLKNVTQAVQNGGRISVSFVEILPESLRLMIEDELIDRISNRIPGSLPWNTTSKSKSKLDSWVKKTISDYNNMFKCDMPEDVLEAAYLMDFGRNNDLAPALTRLAQSGKIQVTPGIHKMYKV